MSVRSTVTEVVQLGKETTKGTGVAASKRYLGFERLTLQPRGEYNFHVPAGSEIPVENSRQKEWSEFDWEGPACYNVIAAVLSSLLVTAASSPFTFVPAPFAVDSINAFTIETGQSGTAEKAAYGIFSSFGMQADKSDVKISGNGFARQLQESITLTASPTSVVAAPIDPDRIDVKIGDTAAGVAAIEWDSFNFQIGPRWAPHVIGGTASNSFDEHKKMRADHSMELQIEHASASAAYLTDLRAKSTKYCEITALSLEEYGVGTAYNLSILFPFRFKSTPKRGDKDGVFDSTWVLQPVYEPAFNTTGGWLKVVVTNGLSSL